MQKKIGGISFRALVIGALLAGMISILSPFAAYRLDSSFVTLNYISFGVVFSFLMLVVLNAALKAIHPGGALDPGELILIFIMISVSSCIPVYGIVGFLIGTLAAPYYFVSPENRWAMLHNDIPKWAVPSNERGAMTWFFEGLPKGETIPWGTWFVPLFWWFSFILVLFFVSLCIVVMLRKQWVEKERLIFPLARIPMVMVEGKKTWPDFMKNRLFWVGFCISIGIVFWTIAHWFNPMIPQIPRGGYDSIVIGPDVRIGRSFPPIQLKLYLTFFVLAYLVNLDVLFGVWFFNLLSVLQIGIFTRMGYSLGKADTYCCGYPSIGWQSAGAMIFMVLWGLWMARVHLREVFRKAFGRARDVDDSKELFSYRTAVFGLIFGLIYLFGWLHNLGIEFKALMIFVPAALIFYIGITRVVAEGGLAHVRGPQLPQVTTFYTLGSSALSTSSITGLSLTYAVVIEIRCFFMYFASQATKLRDAMKLNKKAVLWAIAIALIVSTSLSTWYTIRMGYQTGAYNIGEWTFMNGAKTPFNTAVAKISNPFGPDLKRLTFMGSGAAAMAGLTLMRYRFLWWPIHPLGYAVSYVWPIRGFAFTLFVAWLIKFVILRIGGVALYRKAFPLLLGIMMGHFVGAGIGLFVDWIWFFGQGHGLAW